MASLLSAADIGRFHADGFVIVRAMFDTAETELLRCAMEQDPEVADHMLDRLDAHGAATRIALWNRAGASVYGMAARCERMVDTMEALLGGPVYHFQSKLTAKQPFVGGAWEWHQDYGYWYGDGCLYPRMVSCMIALDPATRENGCLKVIVGSHLLGRLDHGKVAGQVGYAVIPAGPKGLRLPHVSNWSLSISKASTPERQKAAWLFIQWATNKENCLGALLAGVPSGRVSSWASKEYKAGDKQPDWTAATMKSFDIGQGQWNPPVINVPEIRDITGQVIVDAIEGKDVADSARKAAELMNKKMER